MRGHLWDLSIPLCTQPGTAKASFPPGQAGAASTRAHPPRGQGWQLFLGQADPGVAHIRNPRGINRTVIAVQGWARAAGSHPLPPSVQPFCRTRAWQRAACVLGMQLEGEGCCPANVRGSECCAVEGGAHSVMLAGAGPQLGRALLIKGQKSALLALIQCVTSRKEHPSLPASQPLPLDLPFAELAPVLSHMLQSVLQPSGNSSW